MKPKLVLKMLTVMFHGCDRHAGEWTTCEVGICVEGRAAMERVEDALTEVADLLPVATAYGHKWARHGGTVAGCGIPPCPGVSAALARLDGDAP